MSIPANSLKATHLFPMRLKSRATANTSSENDALNMNYFLKSISVSPQEKNMKNNTNTEIL
jgi:hypothetical protein